MDDPSPRDRHIRTIKEHLMENPIASSQPIGFLSI